MNKQFSGFNPGKHRQILLPEQFFIDVLPLIDDLAELKVILFCFRALLQKEGRYRYLRHADFLADTVLVQSLSQSDEDLESVLNTGLKKALNHGVLLQAKVELSGRTDCLYFVNTAKGRTAVQQIEAGQWQPGDENQIEILPVRPNIYVLYEENIGPLTAGIAERLKDAEIEYASQWIVDAINIAIDNNVRRWAYISKILERWKQEGRSDEEFERSRKTDAEYYTGGKYADFIES